MSSLFGARAPPGSAAEQAANAAAARKKPLHERSLSDLNRSNYGKPTIRLVDSDGDTISGKKTLPSRLSHILKPAKSKDAIYVDESTTSSRPVSREGYTVVPNRPSQLGIKTKRISVSTLNSNAETLVADSVLSPTSQRFSGDLTNKAYQAQIPKDKLPEHLEPLHEQEVSDLATVYSSDDVPDIPMLSSVPDRPRHMAHSSSCYSSSPWDNIRPPTPPRMRRRSTSSDLGYVVSPISERAERSYGHGKAHSQDSVQLSPVSAADQERGTPHIIRYMQSTDSIRPQFAALRPAPHHSASINSLWSAASMSMENLTPLKIPRKRAHVHSHSLESHPSLSRLRSGNLPTVLSDDEPSSSSTSQQVPMHSHNVPRRRRAATSSSYSDCVSSPLHEPEVKPAVSYETIDSDIPSSDSAVPEPLFSSSAPIPQKPFERSSNLYSTEMDDTIGELNVPPLRQMRSGHFMRKRSNNELRPASRQSNHSSADSDRWSTGSIIFPQWAKNFYAGKSALASNNPSRVTLAGPPYGIHTEGSTVTLAGPPYAMIDADRSLDLQRPQLRHQHSRTETIDSYVSRAESSQSNWETVYTESPASRIINNVFRGRGRPRSVTDIRPVSRDSSPVPRRHRQTISVFSGPSSSPEPEQSFPRAIRQSIRNSLRHPLRLNGPSFRKVMRQPSVPSQIANAPHAIATTPWLRSYSSIPHLVQNARLARSLTAWRIPSFDEPFPQDILGQGNRQIVCFCLGFIFPPLWMLAAVLPLPQCDWREDSQYAEKTIAARRSQHHQPGLTHDVEVEQRWGWEDERRFLKARWWRTLNRVMSFIGVGILAAIVSSPFRF